MFVLPSTEVVATIVHPVTKLSSISNCKNANNLKFTFEDNRSKFIIVLTLFSWSGGGGRGGGERRKDNRYQIFLCNFPKRRA